MNIQGAKWSGPFLGHWLVRVYDTIWVTSLISLVMVVALFVLGLLRLYCVVWRGEHDWEEFPATCMVPASRECRICGKE